jgi:hypothetical protein
MSAKKAFIILIPVFVVLLGGAVATSMYLVSNNEAAQEFKANHPAAVAPTNKPADSSPVISSPDPIKTSSPLPDAAPSFGQYITNIETGYVGQAYDDSVLASGRSVTYSIAFSGSLPQGLVLNPETGEITGTPTVESSGEFVLSATNDNGTANVQVNYLIKAITPAPAFNYISPASATIGAAFTISPTNIVGSPIKYALDTTSDPLPDGLTLNPSTGIIAGTPTVAGSFNLVVDGINSSGKASSKIQLSIQMPPTAAPTN